MIFDKKKTIYPHLSLQTLEKPCSKGFETSERCFKPLPHLSLPSHLSRIQAVSVLLISDYIFGFFRIWPNYFFGFFHFSANYFFG